MTLISDKDYCSFFVAARSLRTGSIDRALYEPCVWEFKMVWTNGCKVDLWLRTQLRLTVTDISAFDLQFEICMATCTVAFVHLFVFICQKQRKMHYSLTLISFDQAQLIRNTIYRLQCPLEIFHGNTIGERSYMQTEHLCVLFLGRPIVCPIPWIGRVWSRSSHNTNKHTSHACKVIANVFAMCAFW